MEGGPGKLVEDRGLEVAAKQIQDVAVVQVVETEIGKDQAIKCFLRQPRHLSLTVGTGEHKRKALRTKPKAIPKFQ